MKQKKALIVGGSNGIGLAFAQTLSLNYDKIIIADKVKPEIELEKTEFINVNLTDCDFSLFQNYQDIDLLIITAGFGRVSGFHTQTHKEIENSFKVNAMAVTSIIKEYYDKLSSSEELNCIVMGSIAGLISSPLFSLYAATKAAVCRFIESVNIELEMSGSKNRILNVSPGSLKGTKFNGGENSPENLKTLCEEILTKSQNKETLFIPDFNTIYKNVLERYKENPHQFGIDSYNYKINANRLNDKPQVKVGYLSGTFDLFHIGHLNLLKKAKEHCDYLIVGVHFSGAWKGKETFIPFEERVEILKSIKYVDKVVMSDPEDSDSWEKYHYDRLFVGSDYKGTDRFKKYEEFFKDKNVEIIYFPYTKGTSSTQLRDSISKS
ncbi:MAG: SDR family NAD(P)-dependent oxidoreductase [Ruminococcaceae bacterium]|nr:SDR family NAD(P)-dependent oxidoreductase [Oscillospiraceae bacterium]